MLLHQASFTRSKRPGLEKDAVRDSELSDIVQVGSARKILHVFARPPHRPGYLEGVPANTLGMARGFIVAEIDRRAERLESVFVTMFNVLESGLQLSGALRDHLFEVLAIAFDLLLQFPPMEGPLKAGENYAFRKRLNEIIVGARAHRLHAYFDVIHASGDHERHMRVPAASFGENLHAADTGHAKVGDDRIEVLALQGYQGFFAIVGGSTLESRRIQDEAEQLECSGFVVDNEHASSRRVLR
jgi:hypothetical protein